MVETGEAAIAQSKRHDGRRRGPRVTARARGAAPGGGRFRSARAHFAAIDDLLALSDLELLNVMSVARETGALPRVVHSAA